MGKNDTETLKAWCHWKRKQWAKPQFGEHERAESELELVQAVENVISQVGTWKAKYEQAVAAPTRNAVKAGCSKCGLTISGTVTRVDPKGNFIHRDCVTQNPTCSHCGSSGMVHYSNCGRTVKAAKPGKR